MWAVGDLPLTLRQREGRWRLEGGWDFAREWIQQHHLGGAYQRRKDLLELVSLALQEDPLVPPGRIAPQTPRAPLRRVEAGHYRSACGRVEIRRDSRGGWAISPTSGWTLRRDDALVWRAPTLYLAAQQAGSQLLRIRALSNS